jgi:hypothetical protein
MPRSILWGSRKSGYIRPKHGKMKLLAMAIMASVPLLISVGASPSFAATSASGGAYGAAGDRAAAATTTTTWWMQNVGSNLCIDDSAAYGVRTITCDGYNYQLWYQVYEHGIVYAMQNVHTGYCLDDSAAYGLRAIKCDGYNYQSWDVNPGIDSGYRLQNVHTGLCLDDSHGPRAITCNGFSRYQSWW